MPGPISRVAPPPSRGGGSRRLLMLAFWIGLLVGMWLWWSDTPAGSVDGTGAALVEAGRITGMIGGYVLLVQILLMSRVGWLERRVGANELLGWHRDLGGLLVVTVLAHVALITLGYASLEEFSVLNETWALLTTYEDMISAFVATGLLVGIGLLAIRAIRAIIPYELWYYVHLTTYAVLLLSYGHQFAVGQELVEPGFGLSFLDRPPCVRAWLPGLGSRARPPQAERAPPAPSGGRRVRGPGHLLYLCTRSTAE
jgi:predicted ferric reductase